MTSWRKELKKVMSENSDDLDNMVTIHPSDLDLDREFDAGYGGSEGKPFYLWTKKYVYFPIVHDGAEWIGYVPRNPSTADKPSHYGGE